MKETRKEDARLMRVALRLAQKAYGATSPNPMVGAVLVQAGRIIGRGWHHRAGRPHAEIEALQDALAHGHDPRGCTLYVTLEPCCTQGRTPPCTEAIKASGIRRVVVGATDPNPAHGGLGFTILRRAKIEVTAGVLADECTRLNEAFNHWIATGTPFVTVKAAMTLDGKIATASGESKWITGEEARAHGMWLRRGADAILVGINTVLMDDPALSVRDGGPVKAGRRIVLDSQARTPLSAKVVADRGAGETVVVVGRAVNKQRVARLAQRVKVWHAPLQGGHIHLRWLLEKLGQEQVTSLLVEGGGEINASFLMRRLAQRVAFFYAPKILGGGAARKGVAGDGAQRLDEVVTLRELEWRRLGTDMLLTARVD